MPESPPDRDPLVVVLAGPTGVGKSAVAAALCRSSRASPLLTGGGFPGVKGKGGAAVGHVVSADSVQAYRGVMIGANKPTAEERRETPHHLIDVVDATDTTYNAAEWMEDAMYVVDRLAGREEEGGGDDDRSDDDDGTTKERQVEIAERISEAQSLTGHSESGPILPVVVGGTMMYLQWLVHGRPDAPQPSPEALEKAAKILAEFRELDTAAEGDESEGADEPSSAGWDAAVAHVSSLGGPFATRAAKLCGRDWYRLRRILEVAYTVLGEQGEGEASTAETEERVNALYSGRRQGGLGTRGYDVRCFFLCPDDRLNHAAAIDRRCEAMLSRGVLKETADLSLAGELPDGGQPARAIGYRQALTYLRRSEAKGGDGAAFAAFVDDFAAVTRRYAKKQMQWFRKDESFAFVPVVLSDPAETRVESAADIILKMCLLPRDEYDKEIERVDIPDTRGKKGRFKEPDLPEGLSLTLSQRTKLANERQGAGMKFFLAKRHTLVEGSLDYENVLKEADTCTARMQSMSDLPT